MNVLKSKGFGRKYLQLPCGSTVSILNDITAAADHSSYDRIEQIALRPSQKTTTKRWVTAIKSVGVAFSQFTRICRFSNQQKRCKMVSCKDHWCRVLFSIARMLAVLRCGQNQFFRRLTRWVLTLVAPTAPPINFCFIMPCNGRITRLSANHSCLLYLVPERSHPSGQCTTLVTARNLGKRDISPSHTRVCAEAMIHFVLQCCAYWIASA